MENKLNCAVVRDLLPSYVDGLTSGETNQAVEAHLESCQDCSEALRRMREPEPAKSKPAEVDYLKKVRRHSTSRSLLVGLVLMLLGMAILSYRFFYVGTAAGTSDVACKATVTDNTVTVSGTLTGSGLGISRVTFSDSDGKVQVKVYTAPKTLFNRGEFSETYPVSGKVDEVRVGDLIVWEDGTEIKLTAARLFAVRNPYIGDMSSNGRIAEILGISEQFGLYTNELQTSRQPYGWTLILETSIAANRESAAQEIMAADSYAMLAVIDNLGYVTWQYQTEAGERKYTVTAVDATAFAGQDIKLCGHSASSLQALMQSLSLK